MSAHYVCRDTPYGRLGRADLHGFPVSPVSNRESWFVNEGSCDCDCTTCTEVQSGKAFYIERHLPGGNTEVMKVIPIDYEGRL